MSEPASVYPFQRGARIRKDVCEPGLVMHLDGSIWEIDSRGQEVPARAIVVGNKAEIFAQDGPMSAMFYTANGADGYGLWTIFKGRSAYSPDCENWLYYIARDAGARGNLIDVEYVAEAADQVLGVEVLSPTEEGRVIRVTLKTEPGEPTYAKVQTKCENDNSNLVVTAREIGLGGNDIDFIFPELSHDEPETVAFLDEAGRINVTLQAIAEQVATVQSVADAGINGEITFVAGTNFPGDLGNNISLRIVANGGDPLEITNAGSEESPRLTILVPSDGDNLPTVTANDVIAFVNGEDPNTLRADLPSGGDGSALVSEWIGPDSGRTFLAGGVTEEIIGTGADVKAAVEANPDTDALVTVAFAPSEDGSGAQCPDTTYSLSGGGGAFASVITNFPGPNADLIFTAKQAGSAGNALSVIYDVSNPDQGSIDVGFISDDTIQVLLETSGGVITCTANEIKNAMEANPDVNAKITIDNLGDGSGIPTHGGTYALVGGADGGTPVSTAAEVLAALEASNEAMALVAVRMSDGGTPDACSFSLGGGDDDTEFSHFYDYD